jgi:hypothetical protein
MAALASTSGAQHVPRRFLYFLYFLYFFCIFSPLCIPIVVARANGLDYAFTQGEDAVLAAKNLYNSQLLAPAHQVLIMHPAQTSTPPHMDARHCTAQHGTARHSTAHHSTARHGTAQHCTERHCIAQHGTAKNDIAQHGTARHTTERHCTARHSTRQLNGMISSILRFARWSGKMRTRRDPRRTTWGGESGGVKLVETQ